MLGEALTLLILRDVSGRREALTLLILRDASGGGVSVRSLMMSTSDT